MKTPTEFQLFELFHMYDPGYAREYYLRTRKLKGRKKGKGDGDPWSKTGDTRPFGKSDAKAKAKSPTKPTNPNSAKAQQRKVLSEQVQNLEKKLGKLEALIKRKIREEASEDRKGKAKKERAAKESEKPDSAAEKAKAARENKKYRDKNQAKLKEDRKADKAEGMAKAKQLSPDAAVDDLKTFATKVRGQIAVAKQKLAAL